MTPAGYMAKRSFTVPEALEIPGSVTSIYSLGSCVNDDFADYFNYWKHNGYWLFDSPAVIQSLSAEQHIEIGDTKLFYYEVHELQFHDGSWEAFVPTEGLPTHVVRPSDMHLEGFDVVTFQMQTSPECSPLSCNSLAREITVNERCLFNSFDEAKTSLDRGKFADGEPGPHRIFAIYSVAWPERAVLAGFPTGMQ